MGEVASARSDVNGAQSIAGNQPLPTASRRGSLASAGHPGDVPVEAHTAFNDLGLACVIDLRSTGKREDCAYLDHWYPDHDLHDGKLVAMASNPAATAADAEAMMLAVCRRLPYEHADALKTLFGCIVEGGMPLLINCTPAKIARAQPLRLS
ncbi:MAG: tyrosine-protein phosphatase [Burkholderiales bacterium]